MADTETTESPTHVQPPVEADPFIAQIWLDYFGPEIERRAAAGQLPDQFFLFMAQVLFPIEGAPRVLLNDEVKGIALWRSTRPIQAGEPIYLHDLQYVESYELPDELLDNGHVTVFRAGERWHGYFNLLSGRAKARDMLEHAEQFLQTAKFCKEKGFDGPACDNLFSAAELISKAELLLHRNPAGHAKTHGPVASGINLWARGGNFDRAFTEVFNQLSRQRPSARYGEKASRPSAPGDESFELVRLMLERGLSNVGNVTDQDKKRLAGVALNEAPTVGSEGASDGR